MAQAVSRRRVTADAWEVDPTSVHVGFMAHRVETGSLGRKILLFCFKVFKELVCGSAFGV